MQSASALNCAAPHCRGCGPFKNAERYSTVLLLCLSALLHARALSDTDNVELVAGCAPHAPQSTAQLQQPLSLQPLHHNQEEGRASEGDATQEAYALDAGDDCDAADKLAYELTHGGGHWLAMNGSNGTSGTFELTLVFAPAVTATVATLSVVLSLVTVVGNLVVLASFAIDRQIRQATNYFIASLAVSDLLIGLFSMNFYTLYLLLDETWPLGDMMCDLWLSLDYTVCLASQYTVFFITVDRFCSVKLPAKYRAWRTDNKVVGMVTVSWLVPACIFFTSIIGWENFTGRRRDPQRCVVGFADEILFNILLTVFYYWIPLAIMCGLSVGIYEVALRLSRKSEAKARRRQLGMAMADAHDARPPSDAEPVMHPSLYRTPQPEHVHSSNSDERPKSQASNTCWSLQVPPSRNALSSCNLDHWTCRAPASNRASYAGAHVQSSFLTSAAEHAEEPRARRLQFCSETESRSLRCVSNSLLTFALCAAPDTFTCFKFVDQESVRSVSSESSAHTRTLGELLPQFRSLHIEDEQPDAAERRARQRSSMLSETRAGGSPVITVVRASTTSMLSVLQPTESTSSFYRPANGKQRLDACMLPPSASACSMPAGSGTNSGSFQSGSRASQNEIVQLDSSDSRPSVSGLDVYCVVPKDEYSLVQPAVPANGRKVANCLRLRVGFSKHQLASSVRQRIRRAWEAVHDRFGNLSVWINPLEEQQRASFMQKKSRSENRARKALRMIVFILGAFMICWTPYHIVIFVSSGCGDCVNVHLARFTYWLCYLNSPINPFCYAFMNAQFKKTFLRILRFDLRRT